MTSITRPPVWRRPKATDTGLSSQAMGTPGGSGRPLLRSLAFLVLAAIPLQSQAQPFQQSAKLFGTSGITHIGQGTTVAVSRDGTAALVGGAKDDAVWAFQRTASGWVENGHLSLTLLGVTSVALALSADGSTALLGRPYLGDTIVWVRAGAGWAVQADFGWGGGSVALSDDGNTALIGSVAAIPGGEALVFVRSGTTWTLQATLVGSGASTSVGLPDAGQGAAVALSADGSTAIVGGPNDTNAFGLATGAVWVFVRSGAAWAQQGDKIVANVPALVTGFGSSVAISADGNTALAGAITQGPSAGGAEVLVRDGTVWSQPGAGLVPSDPAANGAGTSVALSADGDTALVGAPGCSGQIGAAFVFRRSCGAWLQLGGKLAASGASGRSLQGQSVAMSGDGLTAVIGGPGDHAGAGGAWVFSGSDLTIVCRRWLPAVIHKDVPSKGARWRSDAAILNTSACTGHVTVNLHTAGGVGTASATLPAHAQWLLPDVAGALGVTADSGSLEVLADVAVAVTARTYNQVDATHSYGQGYHGDDPFAVLAAGQTGWLPMLVQNSQYRTNIGVTNTGSTQANVTVTLFDGQGTRIWSDSRASDPAEFYQYQEPLAAAGGSDDAYATVTANQGAGVTAYASVIDQGTNDPTTIDLRTFPLVSGYPGSDNWMPVVVHKDAPSKNSRWRSDVAVTNLSGRDGVLWLTLYDPRSPGAAAQQQEIGIGPLGQVVLEDAAALLGLTDGAGSLHVSASTGIALTNRTYNVADPTHTFGQSYQGVYAPLLLHAGDTAWLPQLAQNARFRTNIGITCAGTGETGANVTLTLYDDHGDALWSNTRAFLPTEFYQYQEPFAAVGGTDSGYATVTVNSGTGVTAYASVIDQNTGDPTTVVMSR